MEVLFLIPERLDIQTSNHTLLWTTQNGEITLLEAKAISKHIKEIIIDQNIEKVFVDNRAFNTSWSSEIDLIWIDLMRYMPAHVKKTATLCPDVVSKIQLNYLASQAGTSDYVKAFTVKELPELLKFIGLEELPILMDNPQ